MTTPIDSDGVLTESAARDQFRADKRVETFKSDAPWESDPNRSDVASSDPAKGASRYDPYQLLALAVQLGSPGEPAEATTTRATAYEKWIQNDQRN